MTPLPPHLHVFSTETSTWQTIMSSGAGPCARSYHVSTAPASHIFIHAGCGDASTGRLRDTWAYSIGQGAWTQLADGPGDARGRTAIRFSKADSAIRRFGGFNGKTELGSAIDKLLLSDPTGTGLADAQWQTIPFSASAGHNPVSAEAHNTLGPGDRSVCAIHPIMGKLVTLFGEGKPSPTGGHDAAGSFWKRMGERRVRMTP